MYELHMKEWVFCKKSEIDYYFPLFQVSPKIISMNQLRKNQTIGCRLVEYFESEKNPYVQNLY